MSEQPSHAALRSVTVVGGKLQIAGMAVSELAARLGRTPFYAYDSAAIVARIASLRALLPTAIRLHYAIKANPMPAVLALMAQHVDGMDVASAQELQLALDAGVAPEHLSFAGPGKRDDELRLAVARGVLIHVESFREIGLLAGISSELGSSARVAVRVNPDFELKASGMKMGGGPKPFGIDAEQVEEALARIGQAGLSFEGFQIFSGSQNLNAEAICESQSKALALAQRLARAAPSAVRRLNLGGGFGIAYFPGEPALDVAPIGRHLADLAQEARRTLPDAELVIELGRYLVGEAGLYVCKVLDRKVSRGQVFLVTDGGLHHHLAASGNLGQVIRKNFPVLVADRMDSSSRELATVVGPLCTPLDVLADRMLLPRAQEGDLIAVLQSGAYGLSASPTRFLSHPEPLEVLV
ncbi:MAG TPA: pyridoxal-dependent decarboxylase, exosortase A system-associated [Burkholderiaceae bacterium]|nr:pyridoxal-dependent decarboxylase, exosortase A system-associated [Burkholderiaceae bacterium]